ncbi:hypothetical protein LUX73_42705 [Actinomadura madurae]|nr:four-carbon acid sugar kinase family protein [Actinomadura madurae]MCQ0010752.1 hypothetical protein [Actinomadura madurae]
MERSDRPAPVLARELFASLPPPRRVPGALDLIRAHNREDGVRLVVFDDDPTGDQTVHGVPILTLAAPMDEIAGAVLEEDHPAVFVLTNSRSMDPGDAAETAARLAGTLYERARRNGAELRVISRSDSTLRGHFPTETDALAKAAASAGIPYDGVLLCPAFLEAGRCTVGDVQWVRSGETLRPSCDTEYARDAAFGYSEATLPEWAAARTGRDRSEIVVVSLADLRVGGVARVADRLRAVDGRIVVANAADPADLEVLCLALREAERAGTRLLYRTGPSFVRVRAGLPARPPLTFADLFPATASPGPGLVVARLAHGADQPADRRRTGPPPARVRGTRRPRGAGRRRPGGGGDGPLRSRPPGRARAPRRLPGDQPYLDARGLAVGEPGRLPADLPCGRRRRRRRARRPRRPSAAFPRRQGRHHVLGRCHRGVRRAPGDRPRPARRGTAVGLATGRRPVARHAVCRLPRQRRDGAHARRRPPHTRTDRKEDPVTDHDAPIGTGREVPLALRLRSGAYLTGVVLKMPGPALVELAGPRRPRPRRPGHRARPHRR